MTTEQVSVRAEGEGPLRPAISRRMLVFFTLGDILGAGIYARARAQIGNGAGRATSLATVLPPVKVAR